MATNLFDLLESEDAKLARKITDYYDGRQLKYLEKMLEEPGSGRKNHVARGIVPRERNLFKAIISKSGLISNDKLPLFEVYDQAGKEINEVETEKLNQMLKDADIEDLIKNNDPMIRSLASTKVLTQYDFEKKKFVYDILGLHNSYLTLDEYHNPNMLLYITGTDGKYTRFRVYTNDLVEDYKVDTKTGVETKINSQPNVYGFISISNFNDTIKPRCSAFHTPPTDLIQINDIYNLHLTDSEYALSYMKYGTWVTNCTILATDAAQIGRTLREVKDRSTPVMTNNATGTTLTLGPGQVIQLDSSKVDSVFFDFKSPNIDLKPLDEVVCQWVDSFANDWSVVVDQGGSADSGFKLIVKELPNIDMKKARAKMQECGYEQLASQMMRIANIFAPGTFSEGSKPHVKFYDPILPVDEAADEATWSLRIQAGRATRLDYFIQKYDMTRTQAEEKIAEIDELRNASQVATLTDMRNVPNVSSALKMTMTGGDIVKTDLGN
jgi:hypothetical protein